MRVSAAGKIGLGFASLNERDSGDDLLSLAFDLQNLVGRFQLRADGERPRHQLRLMEKVCRCAS